MLIRLVDAEQITKERALDAAMTIRRVNPDFTPKLLQDFVSKLNGPENII
jgi:hypothetical protein